MKKLILLLLITTALNYTYSQNFKFGKVSKEELQEEKHPLDPEAEAAYLFKDRHTYYNVVSDGFQIVTEIHERIKIYNQEGFSYATQEVFLSRNGSDRERLSNLKAQTYILKGGEITEYKLEKDAVFDDNVTAYLTKSSFTMPNVAEGCVVEFSYKIISPFFFSIDDFSLQAGIPIKKLEAKFDAPSSFEFKPTYKGYLPVKPKYETKTGIQLTDVIKSTSYSLTDVPALKSEVYVDNINNYRSGVSFELSSITIPGRLYKTYTQTWDDVTKNIYAYSSFGAELDKTGYFEEDLDVLLKGVTDPSEKVNLIFNYVKSTMNWNKYMGYGCNDGVRKAYKEKTGNVAEINLMLTAMLRYAGLNANPVLVSTKSHGIPLFPTTDGFNYVISAIEGNDTRILLDATDKYAMPNVLPKRALNWMGRLIRKNGSSVEVDLTASDLSSQVVNMIVKIGEGGSIEGKIRKNFTNHIALNFLDENSGLANETYLEKLENTYTGIEIDGYEIKNNNKFSDPIVETFSFYKDLGAEIIGEKIYFNPMLFFTENENPFKLEKREFPVDFVYPHAKKYLITIQIPEGYKVESIPESMLIALPDNIGKFSYNLKGGVSNQIQVVTSLEINADIVPAPYYESLKEFYSQLVQKETEKIVLTKG